MLPKYNLQFLNDKITFKEHILNDIKTHVEEELLNEMRQKSDVGIELKENEQNSMIPHEIINEIDSIFESYYIKIWRIYVTIGVSLVYIFIARSLVYIASPYFLLYKRKKNHQKMLHEPITYQVETEKIQLNPLKRKINSTEFPSITSLDQE